MSRKFFLKRYFAIVLSIFMLLAINAFCFTQQVQAQVRPKARTQTVKRTTVSKQKIFVDSRYRHNRSYPARGQSFRSLPRDHRIITHGHSRYYFSHGVWYRPHSGHYVVTAPPIGLFVPFLPFAYATVWMHGIPYYYANETYYTGTPGGYFVVEPPQDESSEVPAGTEDESWDISEDKIFIYPRNGQSIEQQDLDRYECHQWAVEQTNYDPTKIPPPGISADQIMQNRADYQGTMGTCLESRGYTVK